MRAIRATAAGGPDVLSLDELPTPSPGPGEVLVRVAAAGVNFIDTYRRSGVYAMPFPHVVGSEGAGTVEASGIALGCPGNSQAGSTAIARWTPSIQADPPGTVSAGSAANQRSSAWASIATGYLFSGLSPETLFVLETVFLMLHIAVALIFLVVVLYSKHLHIFIAPINVSAKRMPKALGALHCAGATLDEGSMWPISWAVTRFGEAEAEMVRELVRRAVS